VQNTIEVASHHWSYAAKDYEASENPDVYEARSEEASEDKLYMKPIKSKASESERALKAVYKRVKAGEKKKDEAMGKEATESGQQQQCILSGEVHLRHRLEKRAFQKIYLLRFPHTSTTYQMIKRSHLLACGVQACWRARSYHAIYSQVS